MLWSKWVSAVEILLGNVCISTLSTFLNLLKSPSAKSNIATAKLLFSLDVHIVLVLSFSYRAKWSDVLLWKVSLQQCSILNDSNRRSVRSKMLPITIFGDGGRRGRSTFGLRSLIGPLAFSLHNRRWPKLQKKRNPRLQKFVPETELKVQRPFERFFYVGQSRIDLYLLAKVEK